MKHIRSFKLKPKLKYKEGDYVIYDKYAAPHPGILIKILSAGENSIFPYFAEAVKPPYQTYTLKRDDVVDLTQKERDDLNSYLSQIKYNL
jgi:hypothetical protein